MRQQLTRDNGEFRATSSSERRIADNKMRKRQRPVSHPKTSTTGGTIRYILCNALVSLQGASVFPQENTSSISKALVSTCVRACVPTVQLRFHVLEILRTVRCSSSRTLLLTLVHTTSARTTRQSWLFNAPQRHRIDAVRTDRR
jgi:hypothetical protein